MPPVFQELVTVYVAKDPISAHLIRGALASEGIAAFLDGEHLVGAVGELPTTVLQIGIQVKPEHEHRARRIAQEIGG